MTIACQTTMNDDEGGGDRQPDGPAHDATSSCARTTGSSRGACVASRPGLEVAPDLARRSATRPPRRGRRCVRGRGRSTAMSATTRPGRGDSTMTRSATRIASGMLWVTMTIVVAGRSQRREQLEVEALAGQRVERAERLVEEQHLRLERERPGERDPLAHPARQLRPGGRPRRRVEADQLGQRGQACVAPLGRPARELERVRDVGRGRPPRQEARLLEDEPDPRVRPGDRRGRRARRRPRSAGGGPR